MRNKPKPNNPSQRCWNYFVQGKKKKKVEGEEKGEKNANNVKAKAMQPELKPDTMKF